jgi:hypothetical protein
MAKVSTNDSAITNLGRAKGTLLTALRSSTPAQRAALLQAIDEVEAAIARAERAPAGNVGGDDICVVALRLVELVRNEASATRTQRAQLTVASRHLAAARDAFDGGTEPAKKTWLS